MSGLKNQRQAYEFLLHYFENQKTFTPEQFKAKTNWTISTFRTYRSKQFKPFLKETRNGVFRVTDAFRKYAEWSAFREHVSQVRSGAGDYTPFSWKNVLIFDFYMPLKNEAALRTTLDSLFFKDTVLRRLKLHDSKGLSDYFERKTGERENVYLDRVCDWISKKFLGYSIAHVNGRFRNGQLTSRSAVFATSPYGNRYLEDETTAVTRFIFPCSGRREAERLRWFFRALFVESVIELVSGEEEIWLVETGMQNEIHVWSRER